MKSHYHLYFSIHASDLCSKKQIFSFIPTTLLAYVLSTTSSLESSLPHLATWFHLRIIMTVWMCITLEGTALTSLLNAISKVNSRFLPNLVFSMQFYIYYLFTQDLRSENLFTFHLAFSLQNSTNFVSEMSLAPMPPFHSCRLPLGFRSSLYLLWTLAGLPTFVLSCSNPY